MLIHVEENRANLICGLVLFHLPYGSGIDGMILVSLSLGFNKYHKISIVLHMYYLLLLGQCRS